MPHHTQRIFDYHCRVIENRPEGNQLYHLVLESPDQPVSCEPGQFVMVDLPTPTFHFRRPFSMLDIMDEHRFSLYYKVVGEGTQMMAELNPGDSLKVLGPLGHPFPRELMNQDVLLVAGGIGVAPMYFFAREQAKRTGKTSATLFYGARSAHDLGIRELIVRIPGMEDNLILATDDGTLGEHGNICQAIEGHIGRIGHYKTALVCGPTRMMEATTHLLNRLLQEMTVLVSLENRMPCGTGACSGCVVGRIDANGKPLLPTKVCVEGPVFNGRELIWSQVEEGATFSPELQAEGASCSM